MNVLYPGIGQAKQYRNQLINYLASFLPESQLPPPPGMSNAMLTDQDTWRGAGQSVMNALIPSPEDTMMGLATPIAYHGSKSIFDNFSLTKHGVTDPGLVGKGVYLTPSREQAEMFAKNRFYGMGDMPNVKTIDYNLKNPMEIIDGFLPDGRSLTDIHPDGITKMSANKFNKELQKNGHDGVIFKTNEGEVTQVVIFNPSNLKILKQEGVNQ